MKRLLRSETIRFFSVQPGTYSANGSAAQVPDGPFHWCDIEDAFPWSGITDAGFAACYRRRFREGHSAVLLREGGTHVFSAWIASGRLRVDELGLNWRIADADRVVYDCVTDAAHRGRGLYPAALEWILRYLRGGSASRVWIYADARNHASLRGIEKAGFVDEGSMTAYWVTDRPVLRRGRIIGVHA